MTQSQFAGARRYRAVLAGAVAPLAGLFVTLFAGAAFAQQPEYAPVPPHVEEAPVAVQGGGYCFGGPHPADASVAGASWDDSQGRHIHTYPPVDLRLFAVQDGCYYFIGDPSDFGYRGETYAYYGAHPVHGHYGGGWCFMIGGHAHAWRPWSPFFVATGPWFYWSGAYDPFFWDYWPYYSVYYHHYYPRYYRGGRYYRRDWVGHGGQGGNVGYARGGGRGTVVAPPIGRVPAPVGATPAARAAMAGVPSGWGARNGGVAQPMGSTLRNGAIPSTGARSGNGWGAAPVAPAPSGGFWGRAGSSTMRSAPSGGGWGSGVRSAPPSGGGSLGPSLRSGSIGGGSAPRSIGPSGGSAPIGRSIRGR